MSGSSTNSTPTMKNSSSSETWVLAETWVLVNPDGEHKNLSEYPRGLREVVLLAARECDRVDTAVKEGAVSLADSALLFDTFSVVGVTEDDRVQISSDEDLRNYIKAAPAPFTVNLKFQRDDTEASIGGRPRVSTPEFVATRELAKSHEIVKVNVGGMLREMHRSTADRIPLLAAMLRFPRSRDQPLFLDSSPQAFDVLLELARGMSPKYIETLDHSLKELVYKYAEYLGLILATGDKYTFSLSAGHPSNKSITNPYAYITCQNTHVTTGARPQWNTVFGDTQVPQSGTTYWEVEVVTIGKVDGSFMVGVVDASFTSLDKDMNSSSGGGLGYDGDGDEHTITLLADGDEHNTITDAFPIVQGTRIGILMDADRGSMLLFLNGAFKLSHPATFKGRTLYPALSVYADTELAIKTGLAAPM